MNLLIAIGNVGKDAELRYTAGDKPQAICQFSFALTSGFGDKSITTWLNASVWGKRGEVLAPMLLKGTKIGISGELTNRPYTAKDGTEKYSLDVRVNEVTLLGKPTGESVSQHHKTSKSSDTMDDLESDIPF